MPYLPPYREVVVLCNLSRIANGLVNNCEVSSFCKTCKICSAMSSGLTHV